MSEIDRRTFLALSGVALAGLATSCGSDGGDGADGGVEPGQTTINGVIGRSEAQKLGRVNVIQAVGEVLTGPDTRVTFALIDAQDPSGRKRLTGGTVKVYASQDADAPAQGPIDAVYHDEGLGEKGIYVVRLGFDKPGTWLVLAVGKPEGAPGELYGGASFAAVDRVSGPAPGAKAIAVPTPTVDDHRGVEPYCTRLDAMANPQPCPMHRLSLDVALANGKPTVLNIGTPRFCTSQVCGPVIDVIGTVAGELGGRVNFVHIEVYKDDKQETIDRQLLAPGAAAWGLAEEPITYWIKPDNTITERIVGPVDVPEVRELTQKLLG